MNTDRLYRDEILEHFKNPLNFGKLTSYTISSRQLNPFCGDEIEIFVKYNQGSTGTNITYIEDIRFNGKGCAICIASSSILTEFVKGKTKLQLTRFTDQAMLELLGIEVSEIRKKCALLGLAVLRDCLV